MKAVDVARVKEILAQVYNTPARELVLDPRTMGDDQLLYDYEETGAPNLEFDSLDALEVAACLEDEYDILFPDDIDPVQIATPRRIADFVSELIAGHKG